MKIMRIIIGTRMSELALVQSRSVMEYIKAADSEAVVEFLKIKTTGDRVLDRTLDKVGGKGLFVKELDQALLDGRSDLSVHSLKDMPMELPHALQIYAFPKREDPRDVLVLPRGEEKLDTDKPLGTSSRRRSLQLLKLFPSVDIKSIRGNLQSRLRKLDEGEYGGLVLAAAGLKRLGLEHRINRYFSVEELIPAAGQGTLAVQGKRGKEYSCLSGLNDEKTMLAALCERTFVRRLDGGCSTPMAAYAAFKSSDELHLRGLYYNEKSGRYVTGEAMSVLHGMTKEQVRQAEALGSNLALQLIEKESHSIL